MPLSAEASFPPSKKQKKDRACDACRRRKTKCDGPTMPDNTCTNCIQTHKLCTYVEASKPRGPPKAYVTGLEDRLEALEGLLERISPGVDYSHELGAPVIRDSWRAAEDRQASSRSQQRAKAARALPDLIPLQLRPSSSKTPDSPLTTHLFNPRPRGKRSRPDLLASVGSYRQKDTHSDDDSSSEYTSSSSDTEGAVQTSISGRAKISLRGTEGDVTDNCIRFHGRNDTAGLVETTRRFKHLHMQESASHGSPPDSRAPDNSAVAQTRRPMFWQTPSWEISYEGGNNDPSMALSTILGQFPPPDLAEVLIELYFRHSNSIFPLLHRPTFLRQYEDRLHQRNIWFAAVVLTVFAVASRWCSDERVIPPAQSSDPQTPGWAQAGRQWFQLAIDVHRIRSSLLHPACLFEIQTFVLFGMYLSGTKAYTSAWLFISSGLRKATDVGAHRKTVYGTAPNVEDELWRRAFWHLLVFDRIGSSWLGRTCSLGEEDYDADLPLEVDDDHWDGNEPSKQTADSPLSVTAFNQFAKLTQIMAFTNRTLYAISKGKFFQKILPRGKDDIVKQLGSALEEWLKKLPVHLRWRGDIEDPVVLNQAGLLATTFNLTKMLIYRSLIPNPSQPISSSSSTPSPLSPFPSSLPSLTPAPFINACMEAVRNCADLLSEALKRDSNMIYFPYLINVSYFCGGFLALSIWNLKLEELTMKSKGIKDIKPPLAQQIDGYNADLRVFLRGLQAARARWEVADILLQEIEDILPRPETVQHQPTRGRDFAPRGYGTYAPDEPIPGRSLSSAPLTAAARNEYHPFHSLHSRRSTPSLHSFPRKPTETPSLVLPQVNLSPVHTFPSHPLPSPHNLQSLDESRPRLRAFSMADTLPSYSRDSDLQVINPIRRTSIPGLIPGPSYPGPPALHSRLPPQSARAQLPHADLRFEDVNMHPDEVYSMPPPPLPPITQPAKHPLHKPEPFYQKQGVQMPPWIPPNNPQHGSHPRPGGSSADPQSSYPPPPQTRRPYDPTFGF